MALKIKAERLSKQVQMKVSIPEDLLEQITLYQELCGARSPAYIIVEATRGFLDRDREFQKKLDEKRTARPQAAPARPTEPARVSPPPAPAVTGKTA
jgi:hypothetical protein